MMDKKGLKSSLLDYVLWIVFAVIVFIFIGFIGWGFWKGIS